jgi:Holliday junction DNA helicase RuvB
LSELEAGDVLFIDEIHRLPSQVEEVLYGAMEDFKLSIMINRDGNAKALTMDLAAVHLRWRDDPGGRSFFAFTGPFWHFGQTEFLYREELAQIIERTSHVLGMPIDKDAELLLAHRSRGTPRIANRFISGSAILRLSRTRNGSIKTRPSKPAALKIDELGLDDVDIKYLSAIIERFHGGPVGLETIASSIGEEITNLEDVYEPYLLMIGMIDSTPRGRVATEKAYQHLKKPHQGSLF